ncbi:sugar ABC transporter permease [Litorilinea aerophila]|nr:sugar ABC transporter permease [Litorilinea aerophila]MCC9077827.1 sugar ABC transporter permease [Litorilinea aerophila]GIV78984.1 MAG: sugar ABC transporter permease [Litorilinea sp.]
MMPELFSQAYLPTLLRYLFIAVGIGVTMLVLYQVLTRLGVRAEAATGYTLITPWLLGFLIWTAFPILASLYLSFTEYNVLQPPQWVGLENYGRIFSRDIDFWPALRITVLYAFLSVPLGVAGSLLVAILLSTNIRGLGIYRTIYYLPSIVPAVATALLWRWLFNPDAGLLNNFLRPLLRPFNLPPPNWFGDERFVLPAFIIISLWGIAGANMVIFLGALKNVPRHLLEVAEIDGANAWQRFWAVTLPLITPVIFLQLVMGIIGALQIFTVAAFIRYTPAAGKFMNILIYQAGFQQFRMGYASALAWILFAIILGLTLLIFRSSEAWVYYETTRK